MILDTKLNFQEHIKIILTKVNKTIGLLRKLQNILPRESLLTIFKSFVRPHLDYGDVVYDQRYKTKKKSSKYLFNYIPTVRSTYRSRSIDNIPQFNVRHTFFRNSYFPSIVTESNNLNQSMRNSENFSIFKKNILKLIRPSPNSIFNCHNPKGVKLLTRLRLVLSHLRDHKFKHNFQDSLNPVCNCGTDVEITTHYLLHCPLFSDERLILINNIRNIDSNILNLNDSKFSEVLLFGKSSFNNSKNTFIINTTIEYIASSKRFEVPLFDSF